MDILTVLGLVVGLTGILSGQFIEGGSFSILLQASAFLIVMGGTLGAVMIQCRRPVFFLALRMAGWAFIEPKANDRFIADQLVGWSALTRREGMLVLGSHLDSVRDPFLNKGLQLVIDGIGAEKIREVLEVDTHRLEQRHWQAARAWEAAAGYSPTIGIIGAVLGLMHVMQNLSDPSRLGDGIAVAFVSTIYGVTFANLLFLPVANKLKAIILHQTDTREMIIDGLGAVASGVNPYLVKIKLQGYLD